MCLQSSAVNGASGPEDAFASELETVLYAQSLVLFAPQAMPAAAHLPLLLDTLMSRQPQLRQAAANTLRHLAGVWWTEYIFGLCFEDRPMFDFDPVSCTSWFPNQILYVS